MRTATADAEAPASNLQTDSLTEGWLATGQRSSLMWVEAESDAQAVDRTIGVVAFLELYRVLPESLSFGTYVPNTARIRIDSDQLRDRVRPGIASIVLTNLTGSVSDISGPIDPPNVPPVGYTSTRLLAVNTALPTAVTVNYDNHHATERPLSGTQVFRVHSRNSTGVIPASVTPNVNLLPAGSAAQPLSVVFRETTSEGVIYYFEWQASSLPNPAADISYSIAIGTGSGGTGEVIGVEWVANHSGYLYDSGTISLSAPNLIVLPDLPLPAAEQRWVHLELSDFAYYIIALGNRSYTPIPNQSGANQCEIGRFIASGTLELNLEDGGLTFDDVSNVSARRSRGGGLRRESRQVEWKDGTFRVPYLSEDFVNTTLADFRAGVPLYSPILLIPNASHPSAGRYVALTGWKVDGAGYTGPGAAGASADASAAAGQRYHLSGEFTDALARRGR